MTIRPSLLALALLAAPAAADLELPTLLADHMVLQRSTTVTLWGGADPGEAVEVTPSWGGTVATRADGAGSWSVQVETPGAGGPHSLRFVGNDEVVLEDVWTGDVWVCSGQSNMQWGLRQSDGGAEAIAAADHPRLRFFEVPRRTAMTPQDACGGAWRVCSPDTIANFSAVAYWFGSDLERELDVPIGLIGTYWGGTPAEAWTSEASLVEVQQFPDVLARIRDARANPGGEDSLASLRARWWEGWGATDPGAQGGWMEASFDAGDWRTTEVPGTWESLDLGGWDGVLWYRRTVDVPEAWAGRELQLHLGPIDDMDVAWFNGVEVGGMKGEGSWNTPREYTVPAELVRAGANTITVCAVDTGGVGRFGMEAEQMTLAPAGGDAIPLAGTWRWRAGAPLGDLGAWPRGTWFNSNTPTALYNGMIHPLLRTAITGAIWYQGEANVKRAAQYRTLFPTMIRDWRGAFGQGEFPFYFVQLAPFGYGGDTGQAAELREAQLLTLGLPATGMAVTMDVGNPRDIHPRDKRTVGHRLALLALAKNYGRDVPCEGPGYRSMVVEADQIRVVFDHADGLTSGDGAPTCFTIAGEDRVFHPAEARIEGRSVVVASPAVPAPVAVRFAWGAADGPNLRNGAGLPASSFRTDDWPMVSRDR